MRISPDQGLQFSQMLVREEEPLANIDQVSISWLFGTVFCGLCNYQEDSLLFFSYQCLDSFLRLLVIFQF